MTASFFIDKTLDKKEKYESTLPQLKALIETEKSWVANLANTAAVLKSTFNFFWIGFYIFDGTELVLGPFQGPVACTRIKIGKGVCGKSYERAETILVPNVDLFEDHISCSSESKSEIVVPVLKGGQVLAVLDAASAVHCCALKNENPFSPEATL